MRFLLLIITFSLASALHAAAQSCQRPGQTPQSAFPVCGTRNLTQTSVPICDGRILRLNFCGTVDPDTDYEDKNPFYYKFTCFQAGSLGFTIVPNDLDDDYDWHIFDVTGRNVNDIYTDPTLQICGNWSARPGRTGASNAGQTLINCAGDDYPNFSSMPDLKVGHEYLLLVSHFTDTQSGYTLSFGGGTAVITDPNTGKFNSADYRCHHNRVVIKFSKKFRCNTLAADGSDFEVLGTPARVLSAEGVNCNNAFDMDSVVLTLDRPLGPGNYTVRMKNGTDRNTLLDACDVPIAAGENIIMTIGVPQPVPFDSIKPVGCKPDRLMVILKKPVRCNSVAANGSDFRITNVGTGPAVSVRSAKVFCDDELTDSIEVVLNGPVYLDGSFRLDLVQGTDGNTLVSECFVQTPLGQSVPFLTSDTVNAAYAWRTRLDCASDTIYLEHDRAHNVSEWTWLFDDGTTQTGPAASKVYYKGNFGVKPVKLTVSNRQCQDDHSERIDLPNELVAAFTPESWVLCPLDLVRISNQSTGNIMAHRWSLGHGPGSQQRTPAPYRYPMSEREESYDVRLIVVDNLQCEDTVIHQLKTVPSCYVAVPTAFTPNGDGVNDFLYPLNGYKTADLLFRVFSRNGQMVFETRNWQRKWDGRIKGALAPVGTYAWFLEYTNTELNQRVFLKGVSTLLR